MIITKKSVYHHLIRPLQKSGYNVTLVGSILYKGYSNKDIDILLKLPTYPKSEKIFLKFEAYLKKLNWTWNIEMETAEYGLFHNYQKRNRIGLDIFIQEGAI